MQARYKDRLVVVGVLQGMVAASRSHLYSRQGKLVRSIFHRTPVTYAMSLEHARKRTSLKYVCMVLLMADGQSIISARIRLMSSSISAAVTFSTKPLPVLA